MRFSAEGRRVILLAVVALGLGGYVYLTTPGKKASSGASEKPAPRVVISFRPERVTRLEVMHEGATLVCRRTPQGWTLEPGATILRPGVVDDFLQNLSNLIEIGEVEEAGEGLAQYGLDRPPSYLKLEIADEGTRTLALGSHNPVQTSIYARVDDASRVVLIGSVILWEVRKLFIAARS